MPLPTLARLDPIAMRSFRNRLAQQGKADARDERDFKFKTEQEQNRLADEARKVVSKAVADGMPLKDAWAAFGEGIPPQEYGAYEFIEKQAKQLAKDKAAGRISGGLESLTGTPAQLPDISGSNLGQLSTPSSAPQQDRVDHHTGVSPPTGQGQTGVSPATIVVENPGLPPDVFSAERERLKNMGFNNSDQVSIFRNAQFLSRSKDRLDEVLSKGRTPAQQGARVQADASTRRSFNSANRRLLVESYGTAAAALRSGEMEQEQFDAMQLDVRRSVPSQRIYEEISQQGTAESYKRGIDEARRRVSAMGDQSDVMTARLAAQGRKEGMESLSFEDREFLIGMERAIFDPMLNRAVLVQPGTATKMYDRRASLAIVPALVDVLETAFVDLGKTGFGDKIAGFEGLDSIQRAKRVFQLQGKEEGMVKTLVQGLLIKVARMDQDARLSDMDLMLWMDALPSLIDAGFTDTGELNPQLVGRFEGIRKLISIEADSILTGDAKKQADLDKSIMRASITNVAEAERKSALFRSWQGKEITEKEFFDKMRSGAVAPGQFDPRADTSNQITLTPEEQAVMDEIMGQ